MVTKRKDGRAFSANERQAFIFKTVLDLINGKKSLYDIEGRTWTDKVLSLYQDYKNKKLTLKQIEAKAYNFLQQEVTIPNLGLCKVNISRQYETILNPNYYFKKKDTYKELYYYVEPEAITAENIAKIFRYGFNPKKRNLFGTQKNEILTHPNNAVIRVCSYRKLVRDGNNMTFELENEGTPMEKISPKDIVSIQYSLKLKA